MAITPEKLVKILDCYQSGLVVQALAEAHLESCDGRKAGKARDSLNEINKLMANFRQYIWEAHRQGVKIDHDDITRYLRNR